MNKNILLLPLLLSACTPPLTREQQLNIYRNRCLDYGYVRGTVEFADCMKGQEAQAEELAIKQRKARALEERNQIEKKRIEAEEKERANSKFKITW